MTNNSYENTEYITEPVFSLEKKVLERLGKTTGRVEFHNEEDNSGWGGCDTCDYTVYGFSVTVDGVTEWPRESVINKTGGRLDMDEGGRLDDNTQTLGYATALGDFFRWLNGEYE